MTAYYKPQCWYLANGSIVETFITRADINAKEENIRAQNCKDLTKTIQTLRRDFPNNIGFHETEKVIIADMIRFDCDLRPLRD